MTPTGGVLRERAASWRRLYVRRALIDGASRLAITVVATASAALWIDQTFMLPQRARLALLAAAAPALAWALWFWIARPWTRQEWRALFEEAARRYPEARDYLLPAWELARRGDSPGTSPQLRQAHLAATDALLASLPRRPLFEWRPGPRLRAAGLAAAALALSLPGISSRAAWDRLLRPWRDVPLERFLRIGPGDAQVDWGRGVTIAADWTDEAPAGRSRHELILWIKESQGWRRAAWDKAGGIEHRFTAEELTAPLRYRLAWRDLESRVYALTPVSTPQLDNVRARIHGLEPTTAPLTPAEPLSVMRGTFVTIAGAPNQPLARARMRLSSQPQPISMRLASSGDYEVGFVAQEDATLRFELETSDGRADRDAATYSLRALADQPPVEELVSPLQPLQASASDVIPIAYSAKDDGGLSRVSLLVRAPGREEREIALERPSGRRELVGDYSWELSGLPPGRVEFQLKAVDAAASPQAGLSAKGSVEIVDFEAAHARIRKLWDKAEQDVKAAGDRADRARAELEAGRQAQDDIQALAREWAQASSAMRQLADAMAQDAYSHPGLAEQADAAAQAMSRAQGREVPQAHQAAREGQAAEAARRHERLARQMRQAQRLLSEGRKLQGLQDFYSQTGRMAQDGASLDAGIEALARGAKPSTEAKAKLDAALSRIQKQLEELQKSVDALPKAAPDAAQASQVMEMPVQSARESADALARALARGDYAEAARLARQLSDDLSKIQRAIGEAASQSAAADMPRQAAQAIERAQALWSEVVEEQARLVERTRKMEDAKLERKIEAQKSLLAALAKRQRLLVSSAAAQVGFPGDALVAMNGALAEFDALKVQQAPSLLKVASGRLQAEATSRGPTGASLSQIAAAEDEIRAELEKAASSSNAASGPEAEDAARAQAAVKGKTGKLQGELEGLESQLGELPGGILDRVAAAQAEQDAARQALERRDSGAALPRQQKALELLGDGGQMSQAASGQRQMGQGMTQPFQRPGGTVRIMRGSGAGSGAQMGFVPLPAEKDYVPPRELREELERSLEEARPEVHDALIKEYFKRIAQ